MATLLFTEGDMKLSRAFQSAGLAAIIAAAIAEPAAAQSGLDAQSFASRLESLPAVLQEYSTPGAAVALIQGGEVTWSGGFGVADGSTGQPVTGDTLFNVGSISKLPTAWATMMLAEQGVIDLDAPVSNYLARWTPPGDGGAAQAVTIRRLLSHTSGLSTHDYGGVDPSSAPTSISDSLAGRTGKGEARIVSEPGTSFSYSGANFSALQLMIEEVGHEDFPTFMQTRLFAPLGMSSTIYGLPPMGPNVARPHDSRGAPLPLLRYDELAAAGMTTTLRDLSLLATAELAHGMESPGRGHISRASVEAMQTPVAGTRWADRDPFGPEPQYGLGHTVRPQQFQGHTGVGHGGSNRGFESLLMVVPETGDGLVVMTNGANGPAVVSYVLCQWRRWSSGPEAECPQIDIRIVVEGVYFREGIDPAIDRYNVLRRDEPDGYDFSPRQLNGLGYAIMRSGDKVGALRIFELNAAQWPLDGNVHDSLAEAYDANGDTARAIEHYARSLELDPNNGNARDNLARLRTP
jgi:CubicO group peptidase (beta-lactamase class C family)